MLVHYGGSSAKKSGLLDRICTSLGEAGISYVTLGGVVPNPRLSLVREGVTLCKKEGVDFLLAVGGGSVIDSAKAIGYGLFNDCDPWMFFDRQAQAKVLRDEPTNYDARADVMWASSLSHNGLTGCGTTGDWATHQIEHELGGMFDVAHGAGLSAVWGSWARYVYKEEPEKFAQFAVNVMGISADEKSADELAMEGICAMEDYFRSIDMPTSLAELGVSPTDEQIEDMAQKCMHFGKRTVGGFKVLKAEDVVKIYHMAK